MNRIILQWEKVQVSCLLEVLFSLTGIPKGLKQKWKIFRGEGGGGGGVGGLAILEFRVLGRMSINFLEFPEQGAGVG